jgi:DNA-binding winged helix-turn-helix (wHTH) protein
MSETPAAIDFRRFRVLPHRRELLAEGRPVELDGRAFDVLIALIEASGAVVDKNTLMDRVWPDLIVEDNSLQAQISALRKAFAADRDLIRTIAGRGYQFTGEIRAISANPDAQAAPGMAQPTSTPSSAPPTASSPWSVPAVSARHALAARRRGACYRDLSTGLGSRSWHPCPIPSLSRPPWQQPSASISPAVRYRPNVLRMRSARSSSCSCSTIASMWPTP